MDNVEAYSLLFADKLMEILLLPPYTGYMLKTMLGFGGYEPSWMVACASLGAVMGSMLNWLLGRMLITCRDKEWVIVETPALDKVMAFCRKFLSWLVIFAWVPSVGSILMVVAGFAKVRFLVAFMLVGMGATAYYTYAVFGW